MEEQTDLIRGPACNYDGGLQETLPLGSRAANIDRHFRASWQLHNKHLEAVKRVPMWVIAACGICDIAKQRAVATTKASQSSC